MNIEMEDGSTLKFSSEANSIVVALPNGTETSVPCKEMVNLGWWIIDKCTEVCGD